MTIKPVGPSDRLPDDSSVLHAILRLRGRSVAITDEPVVSEELVPDRIASDFPWYFPESQTAQGILRAENNSVGDGTPLVVQIGEQRFRFNLELMVDAHSDAAVGASIRDEEDGAAVVEAFDDGVQTTGAPPLGLLLDHRGSNHTDEVDQGIGATRDARDQGASAEQGPRRGRLYRPDTAKSTPAARTACTGGFHATPLLRVSGEATIGG